MIQEMQKKILKMQVKRRFLKAFEEAVQDATSDIRKLGNLDDNFTVSLMLQSAIANTSQSLKEGFEGLQGNFDLSKSEILSLIDEATRETMNKYFESW